ncbi:MAG: hypothetical protein KGJ32_07340 [Xanthomonadaceae bacterium]|nr:hypothetical protein [Xanthomonadaceae bacterium]
MISAFHRYPVIALCAGVLLAGCSQQGSTPAPTAAQRQAQVQNADAARNLETYRQLLRIHNDQMAVSIGQEIVSQAPGSDAAKEVRKTLPEIEQRYRKDSEKARLAALWVYQVSPMAGGTQSTAAIYNSRPSGNDRVQLVLRRHSSWGQSVFLYGSKPGFVCRRICRIAATVDGRPIRIKAFAPPSGEPALMLVDDKAFLAMLPKAKKIAMDVTLADGEKKLTLVYEVGGFDPSRWQTLPRHGKRK